MSELVTLTVDGTTYEGWKTVKIALSIENISGAFELSVISKAHAQPLARKIMPGAACTVAIGDDVVITGYIDDVEVRYNKSAHEVAIVGRDATGQLVDCSIVGAVGENQMRWLSLTQIASQLAEPFGVNVSADVDVGRPFISFVIQPSETVFEAIDRLARFRAVLAVSDNKGGLKFTRAGTAKHATALVLGQNILEGRARFSQQERFSSYFVRGQIPGMEGWSASTSAQVQGVAVDTGVRLYRPRLVLAELPDLTGTVSFQKRAEWEATIRAGRSGRAEIAVQGWRDGDGVLWSPNSLCEVHDPLLGFEGEMLIAGAAFRLDERGSRTDLTLMRKEAFELIEQRDPWELFGWNVP